ncbi:MAG: RagB/SusD family nutrient uptake outer membrane protein, partial [Bacteroides graminisolvens]|nr:RagB/SusD family nutrient uptake outer membrane protein [Bacteroides graminisolvens]
MDAIGLYGSSYNSADKDVQEFYTECYKGIQLANSVIYYGESTEDSSVRLQYVDEARFLRAYYYYLLVQHFGGVALNTTMFESAVMNHARESAENV